MKTITLLLGLLCFSCHPVKESVLTVYPPMPYYPAEKEHTYWQVSGELWESSDPSQTPLEFQVITLNDTLPVTALLSNYRIPDMCKELIGDLGGMHYFFATQINALGHFEKVNILRGGRCDQVSERATDDLLRQAYVPDTLLYDRPLVLALRIKPKK